MQILLNILLWLVAVLLFGILYQWIGQLFDLKMPPPGRFVNVKGRRVHVLEMGEAHPGRPAVVMDSGPGIPLIFWGLIQPAVAAFTRVIVYDRAGLGLSSPGPSGIARTTRQFARELVDLLDILGVNEPVILVGYSFGGHLARLFAVEYPQKIAGIVLLDASHHDQWVRMPKPYRNMGKSLVRTYSLMPAFAFFGLLRVGISLFLIFVKTPGWPAETLRQFKKQFSSVQHQIGSYAEALGTEESEMQLRQVTRPLGSLPLAVLSAAATWDDARMRPAGITASEMRQGWLALQAELAELSTNSIHQVAETCSHASFALDTAYAPLAVEMIRKVIAAVEDNHKM